MSTTKTRYVAIYGEPQHGKTTFGRHLDSLPGWTHVETDLFLNGLLASLPDRDRYRETDPYPHYNIARYVDGDGFDADAVTEVLRPSVEEAERSGGHTVAIGGYVMKHYPDIMQGLGIREIADRVFPADATYDGRYWVNGVEVTDGDYRLILEVIDQQKPLVRA